VSILNHDVADADRAARPGANVVQRVGYLPAKVLFGVVRVVDVGLVGHVTSEGWQPLRRNSEAAACG